MKVRRAAALLIPFAFSCLSCSDSRGPVEEGAALGGEIAARVGSEAIPLSLVNRVAADQRVTPREALHRLVDDAISAHAARARGLDRSTPTSWRLTAARARFTADKLAADARALGPPTDEEIAKLSAQHWREVDRPPAVRVVHAVARTFRQGQDAKKDGTGEASPRARAVADEILAAVRSAADEEDFLAKAKAVAHPDDVHVVVEALPAVVEDGRSLEGGGGLDPKFAKAASELASPGDMKLVDTAFGWHVIRLVEKIPEQRMDHEARRIAFGEAAYAARARAATDARIAALHAATPVVISPSAEQLMRTSSGLPSPEPVGPAPQRPSAP
ncbi:MAG: peptidylprolyl isomerase [Labilithrix sp.]|nr:peptidylprolyl isomerase [Labilithrix sp.]